MCLTKITAGVVSATYGVTRDSVLTLSPLTSTDSAKYKCIATYSNIGSISSSEKQVVVLRESICSGALNYLQILFNVN